MWRLELWCSFHLSYWHCEVSRSAKDSCSEVWTRQRVKGVIIGFGFTLHLARKAQRINAKYNISFSVASFLKKMSYQSISSGILTAYKKCYWKLWIVSHTILQCVRIMRVNCVISGRHNMQLRVLDQAMLRLTLNKLNTNKSRALTELVTAILHKTSNSLQWSRTTTNLSKCAYWCWSYYNRHVLKYELYRR